MTTRIIIARHGNTFSQGTTPRRIGTTDIPLVEEIRGRSIGRYLVQQNLLPVVVFAAPLQRTMQTAQLAIDEMQKNIPLIALKAFSEIDYGEDENQPEDIVIHRIGKEALHLWNEKAIVPQEWHANPQQIINTWVDFAKQVEQQFKGNNILVVSSNGIIRFAPHLTKDFANFTKHFDIKVNTGHICIFTKEDTDTVWQCSCWNKKVHT